MGKMVHKEVDLSQGVPREVAERLIAGYENRPKDLGDMPLLTEEQIAQFHSPEDHFTKPVTFTLTLKPEIAAYLRSAHVTPTAIIDEWVREKVAAAV